MALPEKYIEVIEGVFCEVSEFKGVKRIDIRKWYQDDNNEWQRTRKGISLEKAGWDDFVANINDVDEFVKNEM